MIRLECGDTWLSMGGESSRLWELNTVSTNRPVEVGAPAIEIDGRSVELTWLDPQVIRDAVNLPNGCTEWVVGGPIEEVPGLDLHMTVRLAPDSPVARFRYTLQPADGSAFRLTKSGGQDALRYLSLSLRELTLEGLSDTREVRLSDFNELTYSYEPCEASLESRHFETREALIGPILVASDLKRSVLVAYEHGSPAPDPFIAFQLLPDRTVDLEAVRGNYRDGQIIDSNHPYDTIWMQIATVPGDVDAMAVTYRDYILRRQANHQASRSPYIFYNTWGWQERNFEWNGHAYLDSMNESRVLEEIELAAQMGVEVFVLDLGWFSDAGDWKFDPERFPNGVAPLREALDRHGMRLGLWIAPKSAALSSDLMDANRDSVEAGDAAPLWETEASLTMNIVNPRYADALVNRLIELVDETDAVYFKWDGVNIDPTPDEMATHGAEWSASYTFEMVRSLIRVAERISDARPNVIVDLDTTEPRRAVGLGFLSVGKFFHINHGRFANYFLPVPREEWTRDYVHLRAGLCRGALRYDRWIPSVLFLTHYLPEGSADAQLVNVASLILGQNGIWGDLPYAPDGCLERFGETIAQYKTVRDAITAATPVVTGRVGTTLEVYEKIAPDGRGAVVIFTSRPGTQHYVTTNRVVEDVWTTDGLSVTRDDAGRAVLEVEFEDRGAAIALFGGIGG
jgi:alpha-galactosidase